MRFSKTLMTGAVAVVAVAGSANAGVVDPFTAVQGPVTSTKTSRFQNSVVNGNWLGFATRELTADSGTSANSVTVTTGINGGAWTSSMSGQKSIRFVSIDYYTPGSGVTDLSAYTAWTMNVAFGSNRSANGNSVAMYFSDDGGGYTSVSKSIDGTGSSVSLSFSRAELDDNAYGIDWSRVTNMQVAISLSASDSTLTNSVTVTNFQVVPAPGAMALLGAAGLVGSRRRR